MAKERNSKQIIRLDGRNCFVEAMNYAFGIGKVQMNFIEYDLTKSQGDRYKQDINIYIDTDKFLVLANDILSGKIAKLAEIEKAKGNQYCNPIYTDMGGVSAKNLEKRGQSRADGKSLSRQFKIIPGNKAPFMLVAECGVGEENETGLIVPKYGTKPDQKVQIPIQVDDLKRLALTVQAHYQAFLNAQYVVEATAPQETTDRK